MLILPLFNPFSFCVKGNLLILCLIGQKQCKTSCSRNVFLFTQVYFISSISLQTQIGREKGLESIYHEKIFTSSLVLSRSQRFPTILFSNCLP